MDLSEKKIVLFAALLTGMTLGTAGALYATSCSWPVDVDVWQLELLEVAVDGEVTEDLEPYEGLEFEMRAERRNRNSFIVERTEPDVQSYEITLFRGEIPEEFEAFLASEGGE